MHLNATPYPNPNPFVCVCVCVRACVRRHVCVVCESVESVCVCA